MSWAIWANASSRAPPGAVDMPEANGVDAGEDPPHCGSRDQDGRADLCHPGNVVRRPARREATSEHPRT